MFQVVGECISNKNVEFLQNSDLIIGWNNKKGDINFDGDEKLAMLFARLVYVFEIVNEEIKSHKEYDEFIDFLKGVRIKDTLQKHNLTLPEVADFLSKIDESEKVSFIIDEEDVDTIRILIGFASLIGFDKIGLYFSELDEEFHEFKLVDY